MHGERDPEIGVILDSSGSTHGADISATPRSFWGRAVLHIGADSQHRATRAIDRGHRDHRRSIAWEDSHRPARATHSAAKPTSVGRGKVSVRVGSVHPIISGILGVVPTSRWIFARVEREVNLTSLSGSHVDADEAARLSTNSCASGEVPERPRIAATLGSFHDFGSGITLLFADARSTFGILMILRTAELGPFTSSEVAMLTFALDAASERFSVLRLQSSPRTAEEPRQHPMGTASQQADGAFYVLDADLQIVLAWNAEDQRRIALTGLHTRIASASERARGNGARPHRGWSSAR